jgi:vacuolar-type H+-ATPase subunit H
MKDDVLSKVVEVEKEIRNRIQIETGKAREWLDKIRSQCDEKISQEETEKSTSLDKTLKDASAEAEKKASAILTGVQDKAEKIEALNDDVLKKIIKRHITGILP